LLWTRDFIVSNAPKTIMATSARGNTTLAMVEAVSVPVNTWGETKASTTIRPTTPTTISDTPSMTLAPFWAVCFIHETNFLNIYILTVTSEQTSLTLCIALKSQFVKLFAKVFSLCLLTMLIVHGNILIEFRHEDIHPPYPKDHETQPDDYLEMVYHRRTGGLQGWGRAYGFVVHYSGNIRVIHPSRANKKGDSLHRKTTGNKADTQVLQ